MPAAPAGSRQRQHRMTTIAPELNLPPDHPLRQILDTIAAHPEVREPVLRVLLTEDFLTLPAQVQELRADLNEFKEETREQFRVVNERLDKHTSHLEEHTSHLEEHTRILEEHTRHLEQHTRHLEEHTRHLEEHTRLLSDNNLSIRRMEGHVGRLRGDSYEGLCTKEISVILDGWMDRPILADRELISSTLRDARWSDQLSRSEYLEGLRPDIIAHETMGKAKPAHYAVVEASITFNRGDIENAARRAEIISRVMGCQTDAFVVTHHEWPVDANEVARQLGVTIIQHQAPEYETE